MKKIEQAPYLNNLQKRGEDHHVSREFQLTGLEVATILRDLEHKSLYIKYAKEYGSDRIRALAKDVASRKDVKHPAAYFMSMLTNVRNNTNIRKREWKKF